MGLRIIFASCLIFGLVVFLGAAPEESGPRTIETQASDAPLSIAASKEARIRVLEEAKTYQGTPYQYGGIDQNGLDCSGLIYRSFQDALNVQVPRTVAGLYAWSYPIPKNKLQVGDLVFFNTLGSISHVGIYAGEDRFIHAASEGKVTGVIFSSMDEAYWRKTFTGAGRALPGEEYLGIQLSLSAAPSWSILGYGQVLRGLSFSISVAYEIQAFGVILRPGIDLRPEWDATLGVFRLPLTLSLNLGDKFRIFAGPALSFGSPALEIESGTRLYTASGGFLDTLGLSFTPFSFRLPEGELLFLGEIAWQSYTRTSDLEAVWSTDLAANLRISTGLIYRWKI